MSVTCRIRLNRPLRNVQPVGDSAMVVPGKSNPSPAPDSPSNQVEPFRTTLESIHEQLEEIEQRRKQSLQELQQAAVEIAMAVSSTLLMTTVEQDDFPIERLVESAVRRLESSRETIVYLHPEDAKQLERLLSGQRNTRPSQAASAENPEVEDDISPLLRDLNVQADPSLKRGSVWADGGDYGLLSTLQQRIEDVRECISEGLKNAQNERRATSPEAQRMRRFPIAGTLRSSRNLLTANLPAAVGDLCQVELQDEQHALAEVIGFDQGVARILPFESVSGLRPNARVITLRDQRLVPVGPTLLGRVLDGLGRPLDNQGPLRPAEFVSPSSAAPEALHRQRIAKPFVTGQRVIDGLLSMGRGQRIGLFAGSGVGKSTLLGEIAKGAESDVNVIALIGERGREVRPFLDDCLGPDGLARSITIVSTADQTPLMRVRAAETSVAIADYFRRQGKNVLFMLDSMTRIAAAQREIGLQLGEPPSSRGYTPSVFQVMAKLLEQLGNSQTGSITGIITVLVDGDDMDEPISDSVRSIVDGHIVLDRKLAEKITFSCRQRWTEYQPRLQ